MAFGSDFSQQMSDREFEVKRAKSYGIRTLVAMCSKGIDLSIRNPGYQVSRKV